MRTAFTVWNTTAGPVLSPFFARCQFVLIVDPPGAEQEWIRNFEGSSKLVCAWIIAARVGRVICGFVDEAAFAVLRAAGVDVRVGPCDVPVRDLVGVLDALPLPTAAARHRDDPG